MRCVVLCTKYRKTFRENLLCCNFGACRQNVECDGAALLTFYECELFQYINVLHILRRNTTCNCRSEGICIVFIKTRNVNSLYNLYVHYSRTFFERPLSFAKIGRKNQVALKRVVIQSIEFHKILIS